MAANTRQRRGRDRFCSTVVLVLLGALLGGCGVNVHVGNKICVLNTHKFHESKGTPGDMGAKATVNCATTAVERIRIKVVLQKRINGGGWAIADPGGWVDYGVTLANKPRTGQSFIPCAGGEYRGVGHAQVRYKGVWKTSEADFGMSGTNVCD